jgi:hypothetical protein
VRSARVTGRRWRSSACREIRPGRPPR